MRCLNTKKRYTEWSQFQHKTQQRGNYLNRILTNGNQIIFDHFRILQRKKPMNVEFPNPKTYPEQEYPVFNETYQLRLFHFLDLFDSLVHL